MDKIIIEDSFSFKDIESPQDFEFDKSKLIGNGGFGKVFKTTEKNQMFPSGCYLVKLFKSDEQNSFRTCRDLIGSIQNYLDAKNSDLHHLFNDYGALIAIPLITFKGKVDDKDCFGAIFTDLKDLSFNQVINDVREIGVSLFARIEICLKLLKTIDFLQNEINFIYADVKDDMLFINESNNEIAIIDYDGGGILKHSGDYVNTKPSLDYFDPFLEKKKRNQSNKYSELWSLCIIMHKLIFDIYPFQYCKNDNELKEVYGHVSRKVYSYYSPNTKLIKIEASRLDLFQSKYNWTSSRISSRINNKFDLLFSSGIYDQNVRPTIKMWINELKHSLTSPEIKHFSIAKITGQTVKFNWEVSNLEKLFLNGIECPLDSNLIVYPLRKANIQHFALRAVSYLGSKEMEVKTQKYDSPPRIKYFEINKEFPLLGNVPKLRLSWEVANFDSIVLFPFNVNINGKDEMVIDLPKNDVDFKIVATNLFDEIEAHNVYKTPTEILPEILEFRTEPLVYENIQEPLKLIWKANNYVKLEIDNGVGDVTKLNILELYPRKNTIYTLYAHSYFGRITKRRVEVVVSNKPPVIISFRTNTLFLKGESVVELLWHVDGAVKVSIDGILGNLELKGSIFTPVRKSRDFKLRAESTFGVLTSKTCSVKVSKGKPAIKIFKANQNLTTGLDFCIEWDVRNADEVRLEPFNEIVSNKGVKEVSIDKDTLVWICATKGDSVVSRKKILLRPIRKRPIIREFSIDKTYSDGQNRIRVKWVVNYADCLFISGIGEVSDFSGFRVIDIPHKNRLDITASNIFGFQCCSTLCFRKRIN